METKVVAFLQNQWFKDPNQVRAFIERRPHMRQAYLTRTLFMGCKTGKNLRAAFGEYCDSIYWEEASREIGGYSASAFPADKEHIAAVIAEQRPDLILCFGRIAQGGVDGLWNGARLDFPHPAARFVTEQDLRDWRLKFCRVVRPDKFPLQQRAQMQPQLALTG